MGTSKGYIPPTRPEWSKAKRAVSIYLRNNDLESKKKAVAKYAEARHIDGIKGTAGETPFAHAVGKILSFVKNISDNGLDEALNRFDRNDLIGKSPETIVHEMLDDFTNHGATAEDSLALAALATAFEVLKIETPDDLVNMNLDLFLLEVIIAFVNHDFDFRFYEKISQGRTPKETCDILGDVHGYINCTLRNQLTSANIRKINLNRMRNNEIVFKMLDDAFDVCMTIYEENTQ